MNKGFEEPMYFSAHCLGRMSFEADFINQEIL